MIIGETIFYGKFVILSGAEPVELKVSCLNTIRFSNTPSAELIEYENSVYILEYEVEYNN